MRLHGIVILQRRWRVDLELPICTTGELSQYTAATIGEKLTSLFADPGQIIAWHTVFMSFTAVIVSRGISGGIEKISKLLMPLFMLLLLGLLGYSLTLPGFGEALKFLFYPDFSKLSGGAIPELWTLIPYT